MCVYLTFMKTTFKSSKNTHKYIFKQKNNVVYPSISKENIYNIKNSWKQLIITSILLTDPGHTYVERVVQYMSRANIMSDACGSWATLTCSLYLYKIDKNGEVLLKFYTLLTKQHHHYLNNFQWWHYYVKMKELGLEFIPSCL